MPVPDECAAGAGSAAAFTIEAEGVVWEDVEFDAGPAGSPGGAGGAEGSIVVDGRLVMKSPIPDPREAPYKDAIFAAVYAVERVIEGEYSEREMLVHHWAFRDRKLDAAARLEPGARQRLRLAPLGGREDARVYRSDSTERAGLVPYWAEEAGAIE